MSLEDGEYELDISVLLQNASTDDPTSSPSHNNENIAIRYGFIPDSMDQSKPLKLYQKDQACILRTSSTEGNNKPIYFEGIPQRYHRNSNNGSTNVSANDSYYLTFNKEVNGNIVHLKKLESTIRFNKSRNTLKIQKQVNEWEKEYDRRPSRNTTTTNNNNNNKRRSGTPLSMEDDQPMILHLPKVSSPQPSSSSSSGRIPAPKKSTSNTTSPLRKPPTTKKSITKPISHTTTKGTTTTTSQVANKAPPRSVSSKRPPVSINTPEIKPDVSEPIISESDFEDLEIEDSKLNEFPVIEFHFDNDNENKNDTKKENEQEEIKEKNLKKTKPKEPNTTAKKTIPAVSKPVKPKKQTKTKTKTKTNKKSDNIKNPDKSMELDDEFKDLEDQLQEVLEGDFDIDMETQGLEEPESAPSATAIEPELSSVKNSPIIEVHSPIIEVQHTNSNGDNINNINNDNIDSDESDFEDFHFTGIKIDEGNSSNSNKKSKPAFNINTTTSTGKPRSLRDLVGGGNTPSLRDDGSSSEEE